MEHKKISVCGANSFIGDHLVKNLKGKVNAVH
jgi:nucleoside-diphosphate-sugar epimerase